MVVTDLVTVSMSTIIVAKSHQAIITMRRSCPKTTSFCWKRNGIIVAFCTDVPRVAMDGCFSLLCMLENELAYRLSIWIYELWIAKSCIRKVFVKMLYRTGSQYSVIRLRPRRSYTKSAGNRFGKKHPTFQIKQLPYSIIHCIDSRGVRTANYGIFS